MSSTQNSFFHVEHGNPHLERRRQILSDHPEVKTLFGNTPSTALYTLLLVLLQSAIAIFLKDQSWWIIAISAYLIGALANHALFVIIHECTHNLVFKKPAANRLLGIFANFPQFFPSAMAFSKYHMLHHTNQAEFDYDADLPSELEIRLVKNSPLRKTLFLVLFGLIQGSLRPLRLKKVRFLDGWFVLNFVIQFSFLGVVFYLTGWKPLLYFFLSTVFGLGLHPLGARWIQEHYLIPPKEKKASPKNGLETLQETYSYYGPLNKLCFNMGYHNEHHDFMRVPWSRLPQLKAMAPEFYDSLEFHGSWTALLWRFIFDPSIRLANRVTRVSRPSTSIID